MCNKYWFKPKRYGWGFVPISWEGWLMTFILVVLLAGAAYVNDFFVNGALADSQYTDTKDGIRFLIDLVLLCGVFSWFAEKKTDGDLKWHWGKK